MEPLEVFHKAVGPPNEDRGVSTHVEHHGDGPVTSLHDHVLPQSREVVQIHFHVGESLGI